MKLRTGKTETVTFIREANRTNCNNKSGNNFIVLSQCEEAAGPEIEVSSFKGMQHSRCLPLPHLRAETDPISETSRFLVCRIPDDGKSQRTQ
jgi:hypothetical protein